MPLPIPDPTTMAFMVVAIVSGILLKGRDAELALC
jgi:hypothetical protein